MRRKASLKNLLMLRSQLSLCHKGIDFQETRIKMEGENVELLSILRIFKKMRTLGKKGVSWQFINLNVNLNVNLNLNVDLNLDLNS